MRQKLIYSLTGISTIGAASHFIHSKNESVPEGTSQELESFRCSLKKDYLQTRSEAEKRAEAAVKRYMIVNGVPGVSVGVSVKSATVWQRGFGFSDVETNSPCTPHTVMRIASISKSVTSAIAGKLIQSGKLDVDKSIYEYLPDFPKKKVDGEEVDITMRQLMSHMSGVRHYPKKDEKNSDAKKEETNQKNDQLPTDQSSPKPNETVMKDREEENQGPDSRYEEFHSNKKYDSVSAALELFKNDPLLHKPGTKFFYTTHGFTLVSAVLEKCAEKSFQVMVKELCHELGLRNTSTDVKLGIVGNRSKYYRRNKHHKLEHTPEVDNSCKWAGGGLISNVEDLLIFGNAMLYSSQSTSGSSPRAFLQRETILKLFNSEVLMPTKTHGPNVYHYGLGWQKVEAVPQVGGTPENRAAGYIFHSGAAVGASSILLIKPISNAPKDSGKAEGVCVAVLSNLQDSGHGIIALALELADIFKID
ncbi:beta-lactamase domain-containing protein [Ditylenchus destructor]|uniref:Beta-lactamase domain-containing protein n=1 Tax=Ditylenchus destructor TaxID=166010 RepID=A0AAD4MVW5_9BILA|nr:beta-lactamase domain-containing protein [Ditylenchus destructor]